MINMPAGPHDTYHPDDVLCSDCKSRNVWAPYQGAWVSATYYEDGPMPGGAPPDNEAALECGDCGNTQGCDDYPKKEGQA